MNNVDYKKMNYRRYHRDVYFPENYIEMVLEFFEQLPFIHLTNHSIEEIRNDRNGIIPIPSIAQITSVNSYLVEFYCPMNDNQSLNYIQKLLIRVKDLSTDFDYSYIIAREGFIVSAWSNAKTDIHKLKNNQNYFRPKNDNIN